MKLTDEIMAKDLGWIKGPRSAKTGIRTTRYRQTWYAPKDNQKFDSFRELPKFTTDLNAIVREIEALVEVVKIPCWMVQSGASIEAPKDEEYYAELGDITKSGFGKTAPLALCAALRAYVKGKK